ncbi:MAG: transposase [Eubacteriaceae bacterium]|nr:transposase [Eubacteriaceae bacterium]
MKTNRAYRFRLYPDKEQQLLFAKTFGCVRFVYNRLLEEKLAYYNENGKMLKNTPAHLKGKYEWLNEVDSLALANAQLHLQSAFRNFFRDKAVGFPKFKSKKHIRQSYTTNNQKGSIRIEGGRLKLPKSGFVRMKQHREIPDGHTIKSVTVSREASGRYYASILTEYEAEVPERALDLENSLGLDYSSPHFYTDSENNSADMPHFYRDAERKLAKEQRKLSGMVKGSSNYQKQKAKVALAHEKVRNSRLDWQHKESKRLADRYDLICVEDIDYRRMAQDLHLAKATYDNGFGRFRDLLAYKLAEKGKKLIVIDKWYPSSRECRFCGRVNEDLQLGQREWDCQCGAHLLRDHNAAINIRNRGLAMLA